MLEAIPAAEVALSGKALEVRYKETPGRPGLLIVTVLAHAVEGGPNYVRRSELALVGAGGGMGRGGPHLRPPERARARGGRRADGPGGDARPRRGRGAAAGDQAGRLGRGG